VREEFLLDAIGLIDDHLVEEAGEACSGLRRDFSGWRRGLAAAACLFLVFCLTTFPLWGGRNGRNDAAFTGDSGANGSGAGFSGGSAGDCATPEAGESQEENKQSTSDGGGIDQGPTISDKMAGTAVWLKGTAFTWTAETDGPPDRENWQEIGQLAGSSTEEGPLEELWLRADFAAEGMVYANELYPDELYVWMTTEWGAAFWSRFSAARP